MPSSGSFYQLPDELLVKIFSYLNILDLVLNIQHVDSRWKAIVQDISFWRDYVFTIDAQTEEEVILLLKNMPALRAVVATRAVSGEVIQTLCQSNKCITRLELPRDKELTVSELQTIVTNLPQIQHLAFAISWTQSENAKKYLALIRQLHELLSLRLLGAFFSAEDCFFLTGIGTECPLLHEIDLGGHSFCTKDVILFLKAKKQIITKFAARSTNSVKVIRHLECCKQLQTLSFAHYGENFPDMPLFDLPNLKHLGITTYLFSSHFVRNLHRSTMSNLVKLDLTACSLDSVQFENILDKCMQLKILILKCCLVDGGGFQHIRKCTQLEYLDVNRTKMTDWIVEMFADKCLKLKYLDISDCFWITDLTLQSLMKCKELQTLKLNLTQITGKDFHLIPLNLTKLRELYIKDSYISNFRYVHELQKQMPHLQVHTV